MKVAILSMQEVKNYGSFLQAWSLKHNIEQLGHSCDFINIIPGRQLGAFKSSKFDKVKKLLHRIVGFDFFERIKIIYQFQSRFNKEFFPQLGVNVREVNTNHYDVIVVGSDEVFNCAQKTWFGYSRQLFGFGLNADRLISYAGSFGATSSEKLADLGIKDDVASLLKKFNSISVRDENSISVVNNLIGLQPEEHVDPVFIYNYDHLMPTTVSDRDYMLVYTYPGRINDEREISAIVEYAKKYKLKLISIGHYFPWCDKTLVLHPFEVLAYFKNASCIVTDTFHGSVFSIKYGKPFATIIREMNSNKLTYLLKKFKKSQRIVSDLCCLESTIEAARSEDDTETQQIIISETQRSIDFLRGNFS